MSPKAKVKTVSRKQKQDAKPPVDRFEEARGKAQVRWRTAKLMKLLRG